MCGASSASFDNVKAILVLKQTLDAQQQEGRAAIELIQTATAVQQGAPEPGKGTLVDARA